MASQPFDIGVGDAFSTGFRGYVRNIVPISGAALLTLAVYGLFRYPAHQLWLDDRVELMLVVDLCGLLASSTMAYPWFAYSLDAAAGREVDVRAPFEHRERFKHQAVASFWFWAGVLFGLRYLLGIPSIAVALLYLFYGFIIADGRAVGGMGALGTSVRLGEKRRLGLFAFLAMFIVFNFFGAIALGAGFNVLTVVGAVIGLSITTSITMVTLGAIYLALLQNSPILHETPERMTRRQVPKGGRKGQQNKRKKRR